MNDILRIERVSKRFGERLLYEDFTFSFPRNGLFALVGASGVGKSTLLEMIAGLDRNYEGSIYLFGRKMNKNNEASRSRLRLKEIGFIRQGYDLLELEKALENVALPLYAASNEKKYIIEKRSSDLLTMFDMKKYRKSIVNELSGGEKQRIALARAISLETKILLADEPTGALDNKNAKKVYDYLKMLSLSKLVILVTHDEEAAFLYADGILRITNSKIAFSSNQAEPILTTHFSSLNIKKRKSEPYVPFLFWMKHAFHLLKAKRKRTSISMFVLCLSLFSLGVSVFLSYEAGQEIENAFSSLIGNDCIVMEKEGSNRALSKAYAATKEDIDSILSFAPNIAKGYGLSYAVDWNSFFPDSDMVYILSGTKKIELNHFSVSTPNDFVLFDATSELEVYPEIPDLLEDDQMILGLPYQNMVQLCLGLQINRDYETLGKYLSENEVNILFEIANLSWNYEDNELYAIRGVVPSDKPRIYHTDPLWNSYFYETRMRFPTTDGSEHSYPWVMQKVYYLRSTLDKNDFYYEVRHNPAFYHYLFDRKDEKTILPIQENRYEVYFVNRNSFTFSEIETISKKYHLPHYSIFGEESYTSFPAAMMSGFFHPFYLSNEKEALDSLIETLSVLPLEQKDYSPSLPSNVKEGSYRLPFSQGVTISNRVTKIVEGREAKSANEVVLSKKLYETMNKPSIIYGAGQIEERINSENVEKDYRVGVLEVVGVSESNHDILFVTNSWSIDFFRDELGMSSFYLEPTQVVFEIDDEEECLLDQMKLDYPLYHFENPFSSISMSTESVINYVQLALLFASISSLSISFLLLITVCVLTLRENHNEGKMLFTLGISREDIHSYYNVNVLLPLFLATLMSMVLISIAEYFIHREIASSFSNEGLPFNFSFVPLFFVIAVSMLTMIILNRGLWFYLKSYDYRRGK